MSNLLQQLGEALNPNNTDMKDNYGFKTDLTGKKILHLPLTKKWFDMHVSEVKQVDYREIKPYWKKRLTLTSLLGRIYLPNEFDYIIAVNGYGNDKPAFLAPFIKTDIGLSDPRLCDDKEPTERFRIFRDKIIEVINI